VSYGNWGVNQFSKSQILDRPLPTDAYFIKTAAYFIKTDAYFIKTDAYSE
jgi:hypothetical protein